MIRSHSNNQPNCSDFAGSATEWASTLATSTGCLLEGTTYKIKIYEMGLCTSDPFSGNDMDTTTDLFTKTYGNDNGEEVNISNGSTENLTGGTNYRPNNGTYTHGYIIIEPTITIAGTTTINNIVYKSKNVSPNAWGTTGDAAEYGMVYNSFLTGESCNASNTGTTTLGNASIANFEYSNTLGDSSTDTVSAKICSKSGTTYTKYSSACPGTDDIKRFVGIYKFDGNKVIRDSTTAMTVTFKVSTATGGNAGGIALYPSSTLNSSSTDTAISNAITGGSIFTGPFQPVITFSEN